MARTYHGLDVHSDLGGQFPWPSRFVDVGGGVRQAYVDAGPRDASTTFLLVHGNPTWSFTYRKFVGHLADRFRVIAVDHVGFGRSDKPQDRAYYTLERHIQNLERTLAHAGVDRVVPVVHDWGGPIGLGWATRHAQDVAGLVILNTWAFVRRPVMRLPWLYRVLFRGRAGRRRVVRGNFTVEFALRRLGTSRRLSAEELDAYRAPFPTPAHRTGLGEMAAMIPQTHDSSHPSWAVMASIEENLPRLADRPCLIVWAMRDAAFRKPQLDRWLELFPAADGPHKLADARHFLTEDAPEAILEHIDRWVAGQS